MKLNRQSFFKLSKHILVVCIFILISFIILDLLFPLPIKDFEKRNFAQVVVDKNGQPLRAFPDKNGVWRYPVELENVSPLYLQALINYEDRHYYRHFGVNPLAIIRAIAQRFKHGRWISGASTLTMQVARILKPHKKSFSGKIVQMFMALQLEWHFNKAEILTYYVNYAPFGGPLEGVQAASYAYLGKSANEITESEAALLAVMPQSPSRFRPDKYPLRAQRARDKLLNRLQQFEIWDKVTVNEAKQEHVFAQYNTRPQNAPLLSRRLKNTYPNKQVIESTIDSQLQKELEELVKEYITSKPDKMSASVLLIDNKTSNTLVYIGSSDFLNQKRSGHVDMIQAIRSPGSTLKPFIYGIAIDKGIIHSQSLLFDVPQSFAGYRPKNFTDSFSGPVSVSSALGRSLNMPAVQILNKISPESFYVALKNAGLDIKLPINAKPNLSLALGGGGVSMEQLLGVFSALGKKGIADKIKFIPSIQNQRQQIVSEGSAWIIQNILAQVPLKSRLNSKSLMPGEKIAYKTGTSYGFRDAWVLATNNKFSIAIWLGQPDGSFLEKNTGRNSAVPLLRKVLSILPIDFKQNIEKPFNVNLETICWPLGIKQNLQNKHLCHKSREAFLLDGTAPPTINDSLNNGFSSGLSVVKIDKETGLRVLPGCEKDSTITKQFALWPRVLEPWLAKPYRHDSILPIFSPTCQLQQSDNKLRISGIHEGAIIYPELPSTTLPKVQLKLEGATGHVFWFVNGVLQPSSSHILNLENLTQGSYEITSTDESANFAEIEFKVELD